MSVFHDEVEIEDFEYDEETETYFYPCPCGDRFQITKEQLESGEDVATCPSCSLIVKVIYDPDTFLKTEVVSSAALKSEAVFINEAQYRRFRIDNTDHILIVRIGDRIDFICPYLDPRLASPVTDIEVLKIYSVSQWSYDYCALTSDSVVVGVCNKQFQQTRLTVVFREYTPKPGGIEFRPGRSYHFITTSTGHPGGMDNKHGGLCLTRHMKIKFEVEPGLSSDNEAAFSDNRLQSDDYHGQSSDMADDQSAPSGSSSRGRHQADVEDVELAAERYAESKSKGTRRRFPDTSGASSRTTRSGWTRLLNMVLHLMTVALFSGNVYQPEFAGG